MLNRLLVTLVRHGESQDNQQGIWAGFRDTPLTIDGVNQARALGQSFANVPLTAIYCSDLKRAAMTADEVLKSNRSIPPPPLVQSKSLREINFGQAEGQSYALAEWMQGSTGHDARNFRFPEGESLQEVNARVAKAVRQFILPRIEALRKKPPQQNTAAADLVHICIVAHGIAIAELLRVFMALHDASTSDTWPDPKASYQRVRLENTGWSRLEIAVPFQSDGNQPLVPGSASPVKSDAAAGASTVEASPSSSSRPNAQSEYTDFGELQTDLVEGPADAASRTPNKSSLPQSETAARPVYVRILCQNQTDHLRTFHPQQGPAGSAAKTVAHLAGGGGAAVSSTAAGSGSSTAMANQGATASTAATVGIPHSATLASIASLAGSSHTHPTTALSPSTPSAPGASASANGTPKNATITPASTRSLSSYDARIMARELERAGAASMLAGSEAWLSGSAASYYPASTSMPASAADRQGSVAGHAGNAGANASAGVSHDRSNFPASPGVSGSLGTPHHTGSQLGSTFSQGTPGSLAGTVSPNPTSANFPPGPGTLSDTWQMVCIRVLPLFNGEALRTSIEELNELVSLHVRRTLDRGQSRAIESLTLDLVSLASTGTLTLNSKLQGLEDTRLLLRLVEIWTFFLGQVLPYCEAAFLPFQTDPTIRSLVTASGSHNTAAANTLGTNNNGPFSNGTSFTQSSAAAILSSAGNAGPDLQRIDVRKVVLVVFRDQVLMPIYKRLFYLFAHLTELDPAFSAAENANTVASGGDDGIKQVSLRLLQMTSVLASILSDDEAQDAMDNLLRALRLGSKSASNGRHRGTGEGQGARAASPSQKNNRRGWMAQKARKHGAGLGSEGDASAISSIHGPSHPLQPGSDGQRPLLTRPGNVSSFRERLGPHFGLEMTEDEYLSSFRSPAGSPAMSTPGQPESTFTPIVDRNVSSSAADANGLPNGSGDDQPDPTPMVTPRTGVSSALDVNEAEPVAASTALAA
ncbi:Target of rapamycin complex 2 subunit BIT61 [Pseudozyma hubeiensis]|nr:Target of rapamycin complex 2 subunit BIT61 [Pseudozyma hubeiensis]